MVNFAQQPEMKMNFVVIKFIHCLVPYLLVQHWKIREILKKHSREK